MGSSNASTVLFVVRHGQTRFNAEQRYLGALDPELNANGIAQATALCAALPSSLDAVVCSPLRRARQTADIVCADRGLVPDINHAFRERNVGVFEGLTREEARSRFPTLWTQNITRQWNAAPTDGETIAQVFERVTDGLRTLSERYAGQRVALVAHGFVAKVVRALCHPDSDDFFEWQLDNAAVCELFLPPSQSIVVPTIPPTIPSTSAH